MPRWVRATGGGQGGSHGRIEVGHGASAEEIRTGRRKRGRSARAGVSGGRPSEWGLFCLGPAPGEPRPDAESRGCPARSIIDLILLLLENSN